MLTDLNTYLNKAIPDTRLTIKKYLDVKFEYLVRGLQPRGVGLGPGGADAGGAGVGRALALGSDSLGLWSLLVQR